MPASDRHQRTEKPTPKRRREARERGQVPRSPDIGAFVGLLGASALLPTLVSSAKNHVVSVLSQAVNVMRNPSPAGAEGVLGAGMVAVLEVILPLAAALALIGVAANVAQVGLHLSGKALSPKFNRISPKAGFRRLSSSQNGVNLLKQVGKLAILGLITTDVIVSLLHAIPAGAPVPLI